MALKKNIYNILNNLPYSRNILYGRLIYKYYKREYKISRKKFMQQNFSCFYVAGKRKYKSSQINNLLKKVKVNPINGSIFFYSIDCYKSLKNTNPILVNFTVDYNFIVNNSFLEVNGIIEDKNTNFYREEKNVIQSLRNYVERCKRQYGKIEKYKKCFTAIESIFNRPAENFFEGLQRILFFNQILWQTNHKHNGLGRLDKILDKLYRNDLSKGTITEEIAKSMLIDFFTVLHEYYWFKSGMMLGDTGQIIIVGGMDDKEHYFCNPLTYMFIEVSKEVLLPDPKVFLRCSNRMPDDLLEVALQCIETGIGAPFLSNDDKVIPSLLSYGYDEISSYNYSASACWEPLITDNSCELNNIKSINFAVPLVRLLENEKKHNVNTIKDFIKEYEIALLDYINEVLKDLENLEFEIDPIISLVSYESLKFGRDITRGGAKYNNLGLTSVGMGTVVDSLLNIERLVFQSKRYGFEELNDLRKNNFADNDLLRQQLRKNYPCYGSDDQRVICLTNHLLNVASEGFSQYKTKWGGKFKFGLSSPYYIQDACDIPATFDGRCNGEPFNVHISTTRNVATTELFSFAMQLDYLEYRLNGNVVDFFVSPSDLKSNFKKYMSLLKAGILGGIYQLQINVVDSETLIAAKKDPDKFPNLIVRVWGFSAYFNTLPDEYKDVLINRAIACSVNV